MFRYDILKTAVGRLKYKTGSTRNSIDFNFDPPEYEKK